MTALASRTAARQITTRQADVLSEVVAGVLWMHLSVPADACRSELESCAAELIRAADYGAGEGAIEQSLKQLQAEQFAGPVNSLTIKLAARRVLDVIRRNSRFASEVPPMRQTG